MVDNVVVEVGLPCGPSPLVFGPPARLLFGVYHPIRGGLARGTGVVLCSPLGYEAMCVHRSYRHLAERLAARGFPALRFDYDGTGDSSGHPGDPGRVRAWLDSIGAAVDALKSRAGVRSVALFGVRFGATLAAEFAAERGDVDALVLWAPLASGRAYVRELRAFRKLKEEEARVAPRPRLDGDEEVAGYVFDEATVSALASIDLLTGDKRPTKRAMIVPRDDLPGSEERLARHFSELGVDVRVATEPGYARMMRDPQETVVPFATLDRMIDWLHEARRPEGRSMPHVDGATPRVLTASSRATKRMVREELVSFGEDRRLFGILAEPTDGAALGSRPAIVCLNVGANHHVGPNRMYVVMSRDFASLGYVVFRFDVAGLGDSRSPPGARENRLYSKDSLGDVEAAMDFLGRARGVRRFVLVGLCSGAYLAFHAGIEDARVVGQVLLNPQTFEWKEGDSLELSMRKSFQSTRYYGRRIFDRAAWAKAVRGEVNVRGVARVLHERLASRATAGLQAVRARITGEKEPESEVARAFRAMSDRGVESLLVFSHSDGGIDMIEKHLGYNARKMHARRNFQFEIVEGADHTFTPVASQHKLYELVTRYVTKRFP